MTYVAQYNFKTDSQKTREKEERKQTKNQFPMYLDRLSTLHKKYINPKIDLVDFGQRVFMTPGTTRQTKTFNDMFKSMGLKFQDENKVEIRFFKNDFCDNMRCLYSKNKILEGIYNYTEVKVINQAKKNLVPVLLQKIANKSPNIIIATIGDKPTIIKKQHDPKLVKFCNQFFDNTIGDKDTEDTVTIRTAKPFYDDYIESGLTLKKYIERETL